MWHPPRPAVYCKGCGQRLGPSLPSDGTYCNPCVEKIVEEANIKRQTQTENWVFFVSADGARADGVDLNLHSSVAALFDGLPVRPLCHFWYQRLSFFCEFSSKEPLQKNRYTYSAQRSQRLPAYCAYILDSELVNMSSFKTVNERGTVLACQLCVFRHDELLNIRGPICITGPRGMPLIPAEIETMKTYVSK
jgi:hypothetical protein